MTEQQQQKQQAIDLLESRYRVMENVCEGIDMRLRMYFEDLLDMDRGAWQATFHGVSKSQIRLS